MAQCVTLSGLLLVLGLAANVGAQSIEVRLREDSAGGPIAGALVRLLGARGMVAQGLSNEVGRVTLVAPHPGEYRIKVDRIGWAGVLAGPYTLEAGEEIRRELRLPAQRATLPALDVSGASRCAAMAQGGPLAAALWEEIRKALAASVITAEGLALPLHLRIFERGLDLSGRAMRERLMRSDVVRGHRYFALPAADLADRGFVFASESTTVYAAPDAALLLADEFVATHCFRAVPGVGSLVGLHFLPARGARRIDVQGILWVDRHTSELDYLEYRYTGLADTTLGGRVAFRRLADGGWLVNDWHIRSARFEMTEATVSGRRESRLAGYRDRGARVDLAADSLGRITRSILAGQVWDSIAGRGLFDATVFVEGAPDSIITDPDGRFSMAVPDTGTRVIGARHWRLELLDGIPGKVAELRWGDTARAEFGVPSLATLAGELCVRPEDRAGIIGVIFRSDSTPAAGLDIQGRWDAADGNHAELVQTRANGLFALCWRSQPVAGVQLRFRTRFRELGRHMVRTRPGFQWVEIAIP